MQIYSLWQALDWDLLSKLPASMKMGRPTMLKGQLSRVSRLGNSWMPFTFQPALWALQQPHKHSQSLQQAIRIELAHHYIEYALSTLSTFCKYNRILQSTVRPHQSTEMALERVASHIKMTCLHCLFQLPPWENVNRSTTLIYHTWHLMNYSWEKLHNFVDAILPTLTN